MQVVCLDLEGVLIPEVWLGVAEKSGVDELQITTREIPDYDDLMQRRLKILDKHGLTMSIVEEVISELEPLPGAKEFLDWLRSEYQLIILSDTFYEFAKPFMKQLDWPTIFCHRLEVDENQRIANYHLRMPNHKQAAVQAMKALNFRTVAAGDSYNDTNMLGEADHGFLFQPPQNVIDEFPQFEVAKDYDELRKFIESTK